SSRVGCPTRSASSCVRPRSATSWRWQSAAPSSPRSPRASRRSRRAASCSRPSWRWVTTMGRSKEGEARADEPRARMALLPETHDHLLAHHRDFKAFAEVVAQSHAARFDNLWWGFVETYVPAHPFRIVDFGTGP